jgi:hypothetical protein
MYRIGNACLGSSSDVNYLELWILGVMGNELNGCLGGDTHHVMNIINQQNNPCPPFKSHYFMSINFQPYDAINY